MKTTAIALVAFLAIGVASAIRCYSGESGSIIDQIDCPPDLTCGNQTVNGVTTFACVGDSLCDTFNCCYTNLCNSGFVAAPALLATIAVALFSMALNVLL